ncbi:MAG: hypothetical protein EOR84_04635 [Mesorhizobium sp.]|uniref:hypothetical protein n=1 Tax=Mesorhizobium sp. TaxID=1871066 RepID=UPI000FE6EF60|nr:hypothetical protein [Mesorhizobium sp.]RWN02132.1 MAG: hypothetical protein EOR84_04635 [Mesorhizobium sp.]
MAAAGVRPFVVQETNLAGAPCLGVCGWLLCHHRGKRDASSSPPAKPQAAIEPFDGKLFIQAVDDLRVGNRKIVLCGVAFTKSQSLRAIVTDAARRDYQGLALTCKPVGMGTPCDGNVATKFGDAIVVQFLTSDGADFGRQLAENGILCGQPAQADSTYRSCLSGS